MRNAVLIPNHIDDNELRTLDSRLEFHELPSCLFLKDYYELFLGVLQEHQQKMFGSKRLL